MMKPMQISNRELDVLIHMFQDLFHESLHDGILCEENGDEEELQECVFLSNLYLKMYSYLYWIRGKEENA